MRIYLIGMPGVGKSTIGKALAARIGYTYIDLDVYIEQQAMLFVDEIFHLYGEPYFRALETNALKDQLNQDNVVIACGGGIIKDKKNKQHMNGACIYLYADLNELQRRVDASSLERPLLRSKTLLDLYLERKDAYMSFQDFSVENIDVDTTVNMIIERLGLK